MFKSFKEFLSEFPDSFTAGVRRMSIINGSKMGKGCDDCHCLKSAAAFYFVHDSVWQEAGAGVRSLLCLTCLSERLGRRLTVNDFTDARANARILDVLFAVKGD